MFRPVRSTLRSTTVQLLALSVTVGCFPGGSRNEIPTVADDSPQPQQTASVSVMAIPFGETRYEELGWWELSLGAPVLVDETEVPSVTDSFDRHTDLTDQFLFMHPAAWSEHTLEGFYLVYPDGRLVWVGHGDAPWSRRECAWLGPAWREQLLAGLQEREVRYRDVGARLDRLFKLPSDYVSSRGERCDDVDGPTGHDDDGRDMLQRCLNDRISFRMSRKDRDRLVDFVNRIPPAANHPVDAWSVDCDDVRGT